MRRAVAPPPAQRTRARAIQRHIRNVFCCGGYSSSAASGSTTTALGTSPGRIARAASVGSIARVRFRPMARPCAGGARGEGGGAKAGVRGGGERKQGRRQVSRRRSEARAGITGLMTARRTRRTGARATQHGTRATHQLRQRRRILRIDVGQLPPDEKPHIHAPAAPQPAAGRRRCRRGRPGPCARDRVDGRGGIQQGVPRRGQPDEQPLPPAWGVGTCGRRGRGG